MHAIPTPIQAVLARMDGLQAHLDQRRDWRAVFCRAYRHTTLRVGEAIGRGEFRDAAWMTRLDVRFAEYYFEAIEYWDRRDPLVDPWRIAFEECTGQRTTVIQDVALGMNAHINHDLVLAIVDVLGASDDLDERRRDHDQINVVLGRIVDEVQNQIVRRYAPIAGVLDVALGRLDEQLSRWIIELARDHVWVNVLSLRAAPDPTAQRQILAAHVGNLARAVTFPTRRNPLFTYVNRVGRNAWLRLSPSARAAAPS